jgi:hypothetical protein
MLERGTEQTSIQPVLPGTVIPARFARDAAHFAVTVANRPHPHPIPGRDRGCEAIVEPGFASETVGAAR